MEAPAIELGIQVEGLTHRYPGADRPALESLNFTVSRGEIVGLLGPNGAGKTTTLHAVLGLLQPTTGTVRVFGACPIRERLKVLAHLNFASVDVDLPSNLVVSEALRVFAKLYGVPNPSQRADILMERFELLPLRTHLIGTLSSGEQMRLKLAKALINDPELLLLDEPTLSLDPYMAQKVRDLLKAIQRERRLAILHTSHNMQEVETFCDRILFLNKGRKLAEGTPRDILERFKSRSLDELFIRVSRSGELYHAD